MLQPAINVPELPTTELLLKTGQEPWVDGEPELGSAPQDSDPGGRSSQGDFCNKDLLQDLRGGQGPNLDT